MKNRGAILVLLLIAAGLAAAAGAIWHQYRQTRQMLNFWGPAVAHRIDRGTTVELVELNGEKPTDKRSGAIWQSNRVIDISHARGLVHFRRSLLEDVNFDWSTPAPAVPDDDWDYAVRFTDDEESVVLGFELDRGVVVHQSGGSRPVWLTEKMTKGLRRFFDDSIATMSNEK